MIGKILASSKQSTFLPNFRGVYSNKNLYGRYGPTGETTSTFFFVEEMKNFFLKFQSTFTFETFSMILIFDRNKHSEGWEGETKKICFGGKVYTSACRV